MIDFRCRGARGFSLLVAAASGVCACNGARSEPASHVGSAATSTSESPSCTVVADPTGTIIDASGNSWGLVGGGAGSFTVDENGAPAGYTAEVTQIVYVSHTLWQQNAAGGWWSWQAGNWVAGSDPTTACPVESASCASLTSTAGTITDASGNTWALAGSATDGLVVDENGAAAGYSAQVTELAYVNHVVWQENSSGGWWSWQTGNWVAGSDPTTGCGGSTSNDAGGNGGGGPTPPPQAVAAAYTTLVGGAEFNSTADVSADTSGATIAPLYLFDADNGGTVPPDGYTIAGGILTINTDNSGWGAGMMSVCSDTLAAQSTPSAHAQNNGWGVTYEYGYFEASVSFALGATGSWWPAWWMSAGGLFGQGASSASYSALELDILEVDVTNWASAPYTLDDQTYSSFHCWQGGTSGQDYPSFSLSPPQSALTMSPGVFNTYGLLWTPTQITYYYNGQPGTTLSMDQLESWQYNAPASGAGSVVPNTQCQIPSMFMAYILGTGNSAEPMQVDWVRVWQ